MPERIRIQSQNHSTVLDFSCNITLQDTDTDTEDIVFTIIRNDIYQVNISLVHEHDVWRQ